MFDDEISVNAVAHIQVRAFASGSASPTGVGQLSVSKPQAHAPEPDAGVMAEEGSRLGRCALTLFGLFGLCGRASVGGPGLEDGLQIVPGRSCVHPSLIDRATAGLGYAHSHVS
jgi:hypothetical protein